MVGRVAAERVATSPGRAVPLLLRGGGVGERAGADIALAAASAEIPANLPGLNLLPILKSGEPTPRKEVFGETFSHDVANIEEPQESLVFRWIIEGPWKLLLTYDGKRDGYAKSSPLTEIRPQLFNLLNDPHEDQNLAKANPELVTRLAARLQDWWPVTKRQVLTQWTDTPGTWK